MNYKIDNLQYCNWSRKIFEINRSAGLDAVHVTIVYHEDFDELQLEIKKWEKLFHENSDIIQALSQVPELNKDNTIIVYDNEPRSQTITKKIDTSIDLGYKVCGWPSFIAEKDINDMIMNGMKAADLKLIIDSNSKKDLEAKLALSAYRR